MKKKQLQYQGYLQTPQLWIGTLFGLEQLELPKPQTLKLKESVLQKRLGHRVEQFVFNELEAINTCKIITTNLQIIENQITIGELDCILKQNGTPIHLEIVYKFYLYDETVGDTDIAHWIGPNRKDSFSEKLTKLTQKQLPLLQHSITQEVLHFLEIDTLKTKQCVYFKAQLFAPKQLLQYTFPIINNTCICGFYISYSDLLDLKDNAFHLPSKLDWLVIPYENVTWVYFDTFIEEVAVFIRKNQSPMCWLKNDKGKLQKFFVTWW